MGNLKSTNQQGVKKKNLNMEKPNLTLLHWYDIRIPQEQLPVAKLAAEHKPHLLSVYKEGKACEIKGYTKFSNIGQKSALTIYINKSLELTEVRYIKRDLWEAYIVDLKGIRILINRVNTEKLVEALAELRTEFEDPSFWMGDFFYRLTERGLRPLQVIYRNGYAYTNIDVDITGPKKVLVEEPKIIASQATPNGSTTESTPQPPTVKSNTVEKAESPSVTFPRVEEVAKTTENLSEKAQARRVTEKEKEALGKAYSESEKCRREIRKSNPPHKKTLTHSLAKRTIEAVKIAERKAALPGRVLKDQVSQTRGSGDRLWRRKTKVFSKQKNRTEIKKEHHGCNPVHWCASLKGIFLRKTTGMGLELHKNGVCEKHIRLDRKNCLSMAA